VRDPLNLIQDLPARGVGIRNLADPIKVDSSSPADSMAQLPGDRRPAGPWSPLLTQSHQGDRRLPV
jgi:hypothetical protein